jgi:hypothetical protein
MCLFGANVSLGSEFISREIDIKEHSLFTQRVVDYILSQNNPMEQSTTFNYNWVMAEEYLHMISFNGMDDRYVTFPSF